MKHKKSYGLSLYRLHYKIGLVILINMSAIGLFSFIEWRDPDLRIWLWSEVERLGLFAGELTAVLISFTYFDMRYDFENDRNE